MTFIDTNIFFYSVDKTEPEKQRIAQNVLRNLLNNQDGQISTQVIQEFVNSTTAKLKFSKEDVLTFLDSVTAFPVHINRVRTIREALRDSIKTQFSFWDSLIISAALESGCDTLYTEDLNDGQIVEGVKIVNPFK